MCLFNCFLLTFAFGVHLSNGANGAQQKMNELKLPNSYLPRVKISASKNCSRLILCYTSVLFGENDEKLPWKVAGRFHFKNMFSGQSNECAKNAKEIQFLFTEQKVIVGNESFNIKYGRDGWHLKFDFHQISDKILKIDGAEKKPLEFGQEIFGQLKFGPFLNDYAGLWLLGVDLVSRLGQKPTEITLRAPVECGELSVVKQQQTNCVTFDDKKHRLPGGGPIKALISGGHQIDIAIMPWTVYFLSISIINETTEMYYACSGSLISPEFVLLAAHCFTDQPEGNIFILGFNSSQDISGDDYNGIIKKYKRQYNFNVFIHPEFEPQKGIVAYDLALIKLNGPIEGAINPICLYCGSAKNFQSGPAIVAGWGQMTDTCIGSTDSSNKLMGRYAQLTECEESNNFKKICIEASSVEQGDSGGALLANNGTHFVHIGVLSGTECDKQTNKSLINEYAQLDGSWIEEITGIICDN
uniref:Peptidase S1 domain-containing protein n=1 Tax=Globodera rostochiensis TaxID=31243 RepID=A0A914ICY6_GLORO